jgi:hypothetical protein
MRCKGCRLPLAAVRVGLRRGSWATEMTVERQEPRGWLAYLPGYRHHQLQA